MAALGLQARHKGDPVAAGAKQAEAALTEDQAAPVTVNRKHESKGRAVAAWGKARQAALAAADAAPGNRQ